MGEKGVKDSLPIGLWNWMDDAAIPELGSIEGEKGVRQMPPLPTGLGLFSTRSQPVAMSLRTLCISFCVCVCGGCTLLFGVCLGGPEAMVPEMRAGWVAGASSLFLRYSQLQDSGRGIAPELCHLLSRWGYTHRHPTQLTRPSRENERVILNEAYVRCHF